MVQPLHLDLYLYSMGNILVEKLNLFVSSLLTSSHTSIVIILVLCTSFLSLWSLKRGVFFYLNRLSGNTSLVIDKVILNSVSRPLTIMILSISIFICSFVLNYIGKVESSVEQILSIVSQLTLVVSVVVLLDNLSKTTIQKYTPTSPLLKTSGSLLKGTLRTIIFCIGILIILSTMGVSITPIIASLGIGSLAIALALQPTLENFFSGIQLVADKPIRVGDYIELDSGEQGFVEKIGWRSTWIKMLPNNIVIMPNSMMAQSKLINYYYPEKQLSVPVDVGVHYDSDLEHVERVTLEVAKVILREHKWGVDDYETFVVFHTFDSSSINFTVMLRAQEYFNRFFIKSAFIKALHKRYSEEGIVIPYPIRAVNLNQEDRNN